MAVKVPTANRREGSAAPGKDIIVTWPAMANGDRGEWFGDIGYELRAFSVTGTLGVGGAVQILGSMSDPTVNGAPLAGAAQADETALAGTSVTALGLVSAGLGQAVPSYAPIVTAGDGTTNLTVTAFFVAK